jgi:hypothetical protein
MKSLQLVITLALLAALVSMTAFAGGVDGRNAINAQGRAGFDRAKLESDIPANRPVKAGSSVQHDMSRAHPEVVAINAAALSKYPTVSAAGLSGTYTIPGDFADLPSAAAVLNFVGLDGDVTFELTSASYSSGSVTIGGTYPGAGTYSVTIQPAAATAVTYNFISSSTNGKGFVMSGAKNVTIDGLNSGGASLTLGWASGHPFPSGDAFGATVYMTNGANDISVLNSNVKGNFDTPAWLDQTEGRPCIFIFSDDTDPIGVETVTIDGNTFTGGTIGVKVFANENVTWLSCEHLTITNNNFGGAFGDPLIYGMWAEWGYDFNVSNNVFDGLIFLQTYWYYVGTEWTTETVFGIGTQTDGIYYGLGQATAFHNLLIEQGTYANNIINDVGYDQPAGTGDGVISYGFRVYGWSIYSSGNYPDIYNNRISNIWIDDATNSTSAIRGPNIDVYHNSVHLSGTATTNWASTCLNGCREAYNNAFVNDIVNASATASRGVNPGGVIDYNAIYSVDIPTSSHTTSQAAVAAGINPNGVFGRTSFTWDLHGDSTSPTAAEDIGKAGVLAALDIDGDSRDTTLAGTRDAGADEFGTTGSFLAKDAMAVSIPNPPAGGIPAGVPQVPTVLVKNNSNTSTGSFSVKLDISPDGYTSTVPVILAAGESKSVAMSGWTPVGAGARTFTAVVILGGDVDLSNDTTIRAQPVSSPVVPPATYTFDAGAEGWTGVIDWVRSSTFTKLGGPAGGSGFSWVTERPSDPSSYTEGAYATSQGYGTTYPGANLLTSPWLDLSGFAGTDLYISFQHSIETEPLWDRGWMQWTVDGLTWTDLGTLNDPDGINWYNEALYEHAAIDLGNIDDGTLNGLYGIATPPASWTSNDDGTTGAPGNFVPEGPSGYVYAQLKVTTTSHPALARASAVKFRYVAFSDAVSTFGGWAFDNFSLGALPPVFPGGTISGHAWADANGNGVDDGEADITGTKVYIKLFGSVVDSVVTNGSGDYSWSGVTLPAAYLLSLDVTGTAYTVPFGISGVQTVNHPATGGTISGVDFGTFTGTISGKKYSDVNDNGANDSEPGLAGWTIQVHLDSAGGALVGSKVTDGSGNYSFTVPAYAGVYNIREVAQPTVARQTAPVGGTHSVTINSGTPTATGKDFGNFLYGRIRVQLTVDQNGNGVRDPGDIIAVPSGATSDFTIKKNGVDLVGSPFTLGGGTIGLTFTGLDTGTYDVAEVNEIAGWKRTNHATASIVVGTSGVNDTTDALDFKYIVVSGTKYNDLNGDGVKDGGEPGLSGWTINVSGGVYEGGTSAVTDVDGNYSIDSVFTGSHTVSEVAQSGWTQSAPVGGTYAINGISGNFVTTTGKDFGNFANANVDGIVYRDYNGNGVMDIEDTPISGVTVDLAVNGGSDVSDGSGYEFIGLIATDTVRITVPGGFVLTEPVAGEYALALVSGGAAKGLNFGLFQSNDSTTKYRTFTADQLGADDQKKPAKAPKPGKAYDPIKNKPSTANLVDQLINPKTGQFPGSIIVGLAGQLNSAGKTKAYVQPNKQGSFWASLNKKSVKHTGMARGFDQDLKGKPILKLQKAFAPNKKQNNKLFAELLALKLNLLASGTKTPAGLGVLIYSDPGSPYDGWTIDEIADYADSVMTNYEFQPLGIYTALDTIAAKINGAFYNAATDDTSAGWASPKLMWAAYKSVFEVSFLKPNPGATPKNRRIEVSPDAVPTAYTLEQNYPNPFNPTTTIEFELLDASIVTLKVYNLLGQEVATLFDRQEIEFGETVEFDASSLPSGVYLYRIVAETIADADAGIDAATFTQVKKMVLVK